MTTHEDDGLPPGQARADEAPRELLLAEQLDAVLGGSVGPATALMDHGSASTSRELPTLIELARTLAPLAAAQSVAPSLSFRAAARERLLARLAPHCGQTDG
jgi:hypothetical protein